MPTIEQVIQDPNLKGNFATVYTPSRKRPRFPANCVFIAESEQEALRQADATKHLYPAFVIGPSRSSEGQQLYYLINWLET
jgi:hypothetical protein